MGTRPMAEPERIFTIGVYGKSSEAFFGALKEARVDTFCDIRLRRGVRGSQYAFVNSKRLQTELAQRHIAYRHVQELAPTQRIRELQHEADCEAGITKRTREELGEVFKRQYNQEILDRFDGSTFRESLRDAHRVVFFCVEGAPGACHRSLVASRLGSLWSVPVEHL